MGASRPVPALFWFADALGRRDGWGKLLELSPGTAKLSTAMPLKSCSGIFLSFELFGETFSDLPAVLDDVNKDDDGYYCVEVRLMDELAKRRLSRLLLDILSR